MSDESGSSSLTDLLAAIFAKAASPSSGAIVDGSIPSTSSAGVANADPVQPLLALIRRAKERIDSLSLISANDTIDDLPTSSLRAVLLNSIYAQVLAKSQTRPGDFTARKDILRQSKDIYRAFLRQLVDLKIISRSSDAGPAVPSYVSALYSNVHTSLQTDKSPYPDDAANRRAAKIASMKLERALTSALDDYRTAVRAKVRQTGSIRSTMTGLDTSNGSARGVHASSDIAPETSYDLLILPRDASSRYDNEDEEDEDEDKSMVGSQASGDSGVKTPASLRAYLIVLCHLHAVQALNALDSTYTELQLLDSMPPQEDQEVRRRAAAEEDRIRRERGQDNDDWRLDQRWGVSNDSPILDNKGKPLRPFTILPGQAAAPSIAAGRAGATQDQLDARRRLQAQVFQPSHRLPTMTIDEYLAEEERRGNIIQGGGQASADRLTNKETLALRAEGGQGAGIRQADEAEEEQRRKANEWDEFTEANPKGVGNTMNRG